MDKRRININMKVLDGVKERFPETKEFIKDCIEQECLNENITVEEVIFLFKCLEANVSAEKHFLFCSASFQGRNVFTTFN